MKFHPGQRWYSLTEPELGLGLVEAVEGRQVVIAYPSRAVVRRYAVDDPPLARARLTVGQNARSGDGTTFRIEEIVEAESLFLYRGDGQELSEVELDAELDVATPENRLQTGQVDDPRLFDLRHDALTLRHRMLASPARGFLGGRIRLYDHQLSVARDVCERHRARVLLADEVGLGKTIEALLILHRMLLSERIESVLIMVPPALVHQWLAEVYLRFNLVLRVIGGDTFGGGTIDPESEDLPAELMDAQLFICPLGIDVGESFLETHWDLVIVDEAHYLEPGSDDFELVERLAARVEHILLLSATPDRDGEDGHFRRLALLDPARFHDLHAYREEAVHYRELADTAERLQAGEPLAAADVELLRRRLVAPDVKDMLKAVSTDGAADAQARQTLLSRLLDLHGIGRVMFRNVRARIPGFPRRVPVTAHLNGGNHGRLRREFLHDLGREPSFRLTAVDEDPRTTWLADFVQSNPGERVLVLCADRAKAEGFASALKKRGSDAARFHEDMSTIERDRQAAWFLDDEGPQILISSAIGAEGRNFQVARNLVLLDLPLRADRLEQCIGRVDRIGQGAEVRIHALTVAGTPQDRLRRWFDEALQLFERPWHGSPVIDREFGAELVEALLAPEEATLDDLIERGRQRNKQIVAELHNGRDRLLELTSFDVDAGRVLAREIEGAESSRSLESFMVDAFEGGGLEVEVIGERSYALRAGVDYHRPLPGFAGEELSVTFDRATGLLHPDRAMLTWDHPMVRDTIDQLLAHESGNACVARLPDGEPGVLLEALYVAEPTIDRAMRADRFFPPTPIRVVVDAAGNEVEVNAADARERTVAADPALLDHPQMRSLLPELLDAARQLASDRAPALAEAALTAMRRELGPALTRLEEMATVNDSVGAAEVEAVRDEMAALDQGLGGVRVRLDALRLIVTG